jgi:hypothetical protein
MPSREKKAKLYAVSQRCWFAGLNKARITDFGLNGLFWYQSTSL